MENENKFGRSYYSHKHKKWMWEVDDPIDALNDLHWDIDRYRRFRNQYNVDLEVLFDVVRAATALRDRKPGERPEDYDKLLFRAVAAAEQRFRKTVTIGDCCSDGKNDYTRECFPWDIGPHRDEYPEYVPRITER